LQRLPTSIGASLRGKSTTPTVVCERSHDYGRWRALGTGVATVLVTAAADHGWGKVVTRIPSLVNVLPHDPPAWLLPFQLAIAAVRNRAKQAFLDHERLGVETWQRHVRTITRAIAEDRAGNGIVEVIQEIGEELATAFPARDDDENELPDGVQHTPG
jgi:hypothetical protein